MHDLRSAVRIVERTANLYADIGTFGGIEWPGLRQNFGQREPLAQLHRDVVNALLDAELVHGHDVRVAELDRRAGR